MLVEAMFEQFVSQSPISVMARATIEHALSAEALDELFDQTAQRGYTKDLLFSTTVDLMSLVVCGKAPQVQAAVKQMHERVPVTLKSVYEKLQRVEIGVSAGLVRHVAGRCAALIGEMGGGCAVKGQEELRGYGTRTVTSRTGNLGPPEVTALSS